ncbi:hypothetical protein LWQ05_004128 [Salmonella enterica]|nr:hypothetical protein [Salmonella enterica]
MSPNAHHIRNIVKLLESARYRHDMYRLFSDCMEAMARTCAKSWIATASPWRRSQPAAQGRWSSP